MARARVALFALPVWNETGTRFGRKFLSPPQRTRSDSKSRSRNRSQPRQLRRAHLHASWLQIDEPGEYSREQKRPDDECDGAQALDRSLQFALLSFAHAMSHHSLRRGE